MQKLLVISLIMVSCVQGQLERGVFFINSFKRA
jgi:hypothetical protein